MKKRLLALLLAGAMCVGLAACGNADKPSDSSKAPEGTTSTAPEDGGKELTIEEVWPSGTTVYIDVPAKAGGGTDLYVRYTTAALGEICQGVNFVVTNYDTAEVGAEHTKNAKPDGLTLTATACTSMDNYLSGASNVNPVEDYVVVGKLNDGGPQAIIAKPGAPYHNLKELGDYIKDHPGELVVGCALGGTSQIILRSIIDSLGEGYGDMVNYVQCSSEADKLTQTASGSIDIANCSIPNAQAYEADGKLTILGTVGPKVATLESMSELVGLDLPDTFKTTMEQGIDFSWDAGYYLVAPAGTPDNICQAINSALVQLKDNKSFQDGMNTMATYLNTPDLPTSRADYEKEWKFQIECVDSLGLLARDVK